MSDRTPREWGTKEVSQFLKQHGLGAYIPAAEKGKLKGSHLLQAASVPFFSKSADLSSPPSAPSSPSHPEVVASPLRASSSRDLAGLLRTTSLIFTAAAAQRRNLNRTASGESEALCKLCDQLGILSLVDKRRLWLALIMLQGQQDDCLPLDRSTPVDLPRSRGSLRRRPHSAHAPGPSASVSKQEESSREPPAVSPPALPATTLPSPMSPPPALAQTTVVPTRMRADTVTTKAEIPKEEKEEDSPHRKYHSLIGAKVSTFCKWILPAAASASASALPPAIVAPALPSASLQAANASPKSPSTTPRVAEVAISCPAVTTKASRPQRSPPTSPHRPSSKGMRKSDQSDPTTTTTTGWYPEHQGLLVVKCCFVLSSNPKSTKEELEAGQEGNDARLADSGKQGLGVRKTKKREEKTYYDDISMIRLDARKPLMVADLRSEIHRIHGPLLLAALLKEEVKGVKISYQDNDGDVVNVQSDDSLRYAFDDWRRASGSKKPAFMRIIVEVEPNRCNNN